MEPIILPFGEEGLEDLLGGILELAEQLERLTPPIRASESALRSQATQARQASKALQAYSESAQRARDAARGLNVLPSIPVPGTSSRAAARATGGQTGLPSQIRTLIRREAEMQAALATGNPMIIALAQQNRLRAQNRIMRDAQPQAPPVVDPFRRAVNSSRVAIGPNGRMQLMPLFHSLQGLLSGGGLPAMLNFAQGAGRAGAALGAGMGAAGPIGIAAAAAAAQLGLLAAAAKHAVTVMTEHARLLASGGTARQSADLAALAAGLGIRDVQVRAEGLQQQLAQGGAPAAIARRFGVNPYYNEFSGAGGNATEKFLRIAQSILDTRTPDRIALHAAREFGMQDIYAARFASASQRARLMEDMQSRQSMSPKQLQVATDAQLAFNRAWSAFSHELAQLGTVVLPPITKLFNYLADRAAPLFSMLEVAIRPAVGSLSMMVEVLFQWEAGILNLWRTLTEFLHKIRFISNETHLEWTEQRKRMEAGLRQDREALSRDRNTRAIERLTETVQGISGGGIRARNAIPAGWQGSQDALDAAARGVAKLEGAWIL